MDRLILFVGPTAFGFDMTKYSEYVDIRPPIRRGDIEIVMSSHEPGSIAIVDGTFHSYPAVGHAEIMKGIDTGWGIWGLSSMGAIRAAEMQPFGMKGYGTVFDSFASNRDFSDDEVTLIHEQDSPYTPLSEPLVHIREFLFTMEKHGHISIAQSNEIIKKIKEQWYGYRTLKSLKSYLTDITEFNDTIQASLKQFSSYRLKTRDLKNFLEEKPWMQL